ncbi:acyl-CoA thioesterase [Laceyella putida]|uniref:Acyl-CoA thioesterase n=1 Tax=Laceyella putida TaxID=110101 RepID=A0ABW2RP64_9BACL
MTNNPNVSETKIRVRYQETDQMGVVYHANYLTWFEVGRTEWIRSFGITYQQLEEKGLLLPVVDIHCKYMHPAKYDDEVIVRTSIDDFSGGKIVFRYEVVHPEKEIVLSEGSSVHLWVNKEMKRVNLKRVYPEFYELLHQIFSVERG